MSIQNKQKISSPICIISYILNNLPLLKHEIEGRIFETRNPKELQDMDEAIQHFLNELSKNIIWGGTECLKAVQRIYKQNILIINELGYSYFGCPFDESVEGVLLLAFRISGNVDKTKQNISNIHRKHYDSVIHIEPNEIFSITEELVKNIKTNFMNVSLKQESIIELD